MKLHITQGRIIDPAAAAPELTFDYSVYVTIRGGEEDVYATCRLTKLSEVSGVTVASLNTSNYFVAGKTPAPFAFRLLPVSALPKVDFPTIAVTATLPGASADSDGATGMALVGSDGAGSVSCAAGVHALKHATAATSAARRAADT